MKPYTGHVSRLWAAATVVCMASGPSLTREDAEYVRGKARVIVVNSTWQMAPWADCLHASDGKFWRWERGVPAFTGLKFSLQRDASRWPGVTVLQCTGTDGLETRRQGLRSGRNSGYQAINLAMHLGATRILLLGYDMQRGPHGEEHWHGEHPNRSRSPYHTFVKHFDSLVDPLRQLGIEVVNCSRRTALTCFDRMPITDALPVSREVAA